jgi:hypothetical protein
MNLRNLCHSQPEKPWMPVFQINKPADLRTNPYTGQIMPAEMIPFNDSEVSIKTLKKWMVSNIPNYTQTL